ncbi:hypothetical protein EB796_001932 [Bugula neritina]|uniref:Uncharacterized protein n=1 Tax=Bugula neritina TaxID=10212 RepID=A0A7J7KNL9_BUGNE|nr:hypothetical protein EB796_001932 [Bugula neritina]
MEIDPLYHFSTHYPNKLCTYDTSHSNASAVNSLVKSKISRRRNNSRYKTQPITFDEIKEVEEPVTPSEENKNTSVASFLKELQETSGLTENRLQAPLESRRSGEDGVGSGSYATNIWYDSPYPTRLSFLDVPETFTSTHHPKKSQVPSEKVNKLKARTARRRNNPRYKTQPITFDEIKEVEEPDEQPTPSTGSKDTQTDS